MNKVLLLLGLFIISSFLIVVYALRDFLIPSVNIWVTIVFGSFVVVFGFVVGIKLLSEL